ncbi:hypothetical protein HYQ46_008476 [Verticillium longisporum]|nr:hypothetical protein HYQ46_008476 [Verticillium longisporum]
MRDVRMPTVRNPAATRSACCIGLNSHECGSMPACGLPLLVPPVCAVTGAVLSFCTSVYMTADRALICSPTPTRPSNWPRDCHASPQAVPPMPGNPWSGSPTHTDATLCALGRSRPMMRSKRSGTTCAVPAIHRAR